MLPLLFGLHGNRQHILIADRGFKRLLLAEHFQWTKYACRLQAYSLSNSGEVCFSTFISNSTMGHFSSAGLLFIHLRVPGHTLPSLVLPVSLTWCLHGQWEGQQCLNFVPVYMSMCVHSCQGSAIMKRLQFMVRIKSPIPMQTVSFFCSRHFLLQAINLLCLRCSRFSSEISQTCNLRFLAFRH